MSDRIEHIIVLMLENRSFDQMLGCMKKYYPELDGIEPKAHPRSNPASFDRNSKVYYQVPTKTRSIDPDPGHDLVNVLGQIGDGGPCNGFVMDYLRMFPNAKPDQVQNIMGYYDDDFLPALHTLAKNFAICDHWFSSLPGPTWPNRFFVHTGTSLGHVTMPEGPYHLNLHVYDQETIYDRLNQKGISWKIYFGDFPQSLVLAHQMEPDNAARYSPMEKFWEDIQNKKADFPQYAFIEPSYFPPDANSQHPPYDVLKGEKLISDIYNALRKNEQLWMKSLLVILYDEHGGFYDHVFPEHAIPPDDHLEEFTFDKYGVRVPALLVSPWIGKGVIPTVFDHTSLLKYLLEKWDLGKPLTKRVEAAQSFGDELTRLAEPRTDPPESIPFKESILQEIENILPNFLGKTEQSLIAFSLILESKAGEAADVIVQRSRGILQGAEAQVKVAEERLHNFLKQTKKG